MGDFDVLIKEGGEAFHAAGIENFKHARPISVLKLVVDIVQQCGHIVLRKSILGVSQS